MRSTFRVYLLVCLLAGCSAPHWKYDRIEVTAEFRDDGTCDVWVEGELMTFPGSRADAGVTTRIGDAEVRSLTCHLPTARFHPETGALENATLMVMSDTPLRPGEHPVESLLEDRMGAVGAAFFHDRYMASFPVPAHLVAVNGTLRVDSVHEGRLVGSLTARARRVPDMGIP